jgi:pimeloyl-ACP methyl ester carboxylesterase
MSAAQPEIRESTVGDDLPCLVVGSGPPLVALPGSQPQNGNLAGRSRSFMVKPFLSLAERHTVHVVNRRPGVPEGATFADLAADLAGALRAGFGGPVDVLGYSTGGSLALQTAADHPDVVRRLVVVCSAYRLSSVGAQVTREYADRARAGKRAAPAFAPVAARSPAGRAALRGFLWLIDPMMRPADGDHTDAIRVNEAELAFDVKDRLDRITARTLVVGGDRDPAYPVALLRETAAGVVDGRLIVYKGRNHNSVVSAAEFAGDVSGFLSAAAPG